VRFDATAAGNRPGRHGVWQRPFERTRLAQAPLLLPWSGAGLQEAPGSALRKDRALVLPVPVEPSDPDGLDMASASGERDIAAITYAANPSKKGLERVLAAWRRIRRAGEELVIVGGARGYPKRLGLAGPDAGVRSIGLLAPPEYRALLRRARVFVCAPRREDYGISQLEALADGCILVTTPSPGPYAALPIARALDARLVGQDLGIALRTALDDPLADYSIHAIDALTPFRRESVDRLVAEELLPRLLSGDAVTVDRPG
jgi:hypothetical protein